jgi:hypothetical protein
VTAMLDSGATHSYIRNSVTQNFVAKNKLNLRSNSQKVLLADNSSVYSMGCAILPVSVGDSLWVSPIRVMKDLSVDIILGNDFLSQLGIKIDFENNTVRDRNFKVIPTLDFDNVNSLLASTDLCDDLSLTQF